MCDGQELKELWEEKQEHGFYIAGRTAAASCVSARLEYIGIATGGAAIMTRT